jgi:hypothetical protein
MSKHNEYMLVDGTGMTVAAFGAMPKAGVKRINASGCTSLTEINAPNAESIYASGCTSLTELHAPVAEHIYATGCTALVKLHAPVARSIYASGCTSLTGMIHGGMDSRGYHFFGLPLGGEYRIFAGCRNFTLEEALAHWGPGGPSDRPNCLALVQKIIAEIKMKEQA